MDNKGKQFVGVFLGFIFFMMVGPSITGFIVSDFDIFLLIPIIMITGFFLFVFFIIRSAGIKNNKKYEGKRISCPNCYNEVDQSSNTCPYCGERLNNGMIECEYCGHMNDGRNAVCEKCNGLIK